MNQYLRILIVDDEADCRETYKMLLESKEYAAAAAGSAEEALQLLQQEFYNIILSAECCRWKKTLRKSCFRTIFRKPEERQKLR